MSLKLVFLLLLSVLLCSNPKYTAALARLHGIDEDDTGGRRLAGGLAINRLFHIISLQGLRLLDADNSNVPVTDVIQERQIFGLDELPEHLTIEVLTSSNWKVWLIVWKLFAFGGSEARIELSHRTPSGETLVQDLFGSFEKPYIAHGVGVNGAIDALREVGIHTMDARAFTPRNQNVNSRRTVFEIVELAPTSAPTTMSPTVSPTTLSPTAAPTTRSPTTSAPTTLSPTIAPTIYSPTTSAPTPTPGDLISSFSIVDALSKKVLIDPVVNDTVINLTETGTSLSMIANTPRDDISMLFQYVYQSQLVTQRENAQPYAMGGNSVPNSGSYNPVPYLVESGDKQVDVTVYNNISNVLAQYRLSFTVTAS